jgi:E3 ubiquitin-protein ligase HUWE1
VELKPDGKNIPVTDANKDEYIELMLQDKYFGGRHKEMEELRKGFFSIVPEKCVRILTPA